MATSDTGGLDKRGLALKPSVGPGCLRCPVERLAGRNYCGTCGNRLRDRCERKQVTVLCADVSGYASLSEPLDPQQVSELMDRVFGIVLDVVHEHGGTVNQFQGAGIMALFSERPDGEHHACRAVRAALAVKERLETVRFEVRRSHGLEFRVRLSVNTGPVGIGTIGAAPRTDDTAENTSGVASRLLGVAEPGQIVLTGQTQRFAAGSYVFEELEAMHLMSSSQTVKVYALTRRASGHVEGQLLAAV